MTMGLIALIVFFGHIIEGSGRLIQGIGRCRLPFVFPSHVSMGKNGKTFHESLNLFSYGSLTVERDFENGARASRSAVHQVQASSRCVSAVPSRDGGR